MLKFMRTDKVGLNDFRAIRREYRQRSGLEFESGERHGFSIRMAEVLDAPTDGDDYSEFAARLVRREDHETIGQTRDVETAKFAGGRNVLVRVSGHAFWISGTIHLECQLTEDLDPATAFDSSPGTATANVLYRNSSGDLEKLTYDSSDVQITVTQRFEHWETIVENTFGRVILINDEWRPDDFDCDAAAGGLI